MSDKNVEFIDLESEAEDKKDEQIFRDIDEILAKDEEQEEKIDIKKEIISWVLTLVVTFALIFVLKNYVIINAMVPTCSMENTIMPEDQMFGNRLAYVFAEPERGDVIFFYYPDDEKQKFIKRIIGLPREAVTIENAKVYINGVELEEPYLKEQWVNGTGPYEFKVPEGCYFVMGDNRNTSQDARYWRNTYVSKDKIIGKAGFIYYPFDRIGVVE
jgi:signal peptidase I